MAYKIEFVDDVAVEWHAVPDGVERRTRPYGPTVYLAAPEAVRADLADRLASDPKVTGLATEPWYLSLDATERTPVLRVDLDRMDAVKPFAREIKHYHERDRYRPGTVRAFNVDLAPQFRYCLDTGTDPVPKRDLTTFSVRAREPELAARELTQLDLDGDVVRGDERAVLQALHTRLRRADPDVLVVNNADLVPLTFERADALDLDGFALGRRDGWERLAGESTYESYGRVGHSAARFDVPGRAVINTANSFFWNETTLDGLLDLVARSHRPLQETAWASIGTVLTAIQTRMALDRGVLIPWNKWDPESFKDARTLHAADRGGFTFAPRVGFHEDVRELDFASLYPRIICEHNISPETVGCACHADRHDIPELGYSVCDRRGFLPDVLQPILDDRAAIKANIRAATDDAEREYYEARSSALKWILVACFGYQGYRNSKFGRIECHEAINAVARDHLLTAKEHCEAGGWDVVHGIVDSLWVSPMADRDQVPVETVARDVTDAVGIELELEHAYDWVCFVPRRDSDAGALTKYFAKIAGEDEYKLRGIEARQRSTPAFVSACQRRYIEALDAHRDPRAVCDRLARDLAALRHGDVDTGELVVTQRVSKPIEAYTQRTLGVAAMKRARDIGLARHPGQDVHYVVIDGDPDSRDRVRLSFEDPDAYDAEHYASLLVRACESIVSPLGWNQARIERHLRGSRDLALDAFT